MIDELGTRSGTPALLRLATSALLGAGADMATAQMRCDDGTLRLVAAVGFDRVFMDHFAVVAGDGAACARAAASRDVVEIDDVARSSTYDDRDRDAMLAAGSAACISAPILQSAVISAHYRQPGLHSRAAVRGVARELSQVLARVPKLAQWMPSHDAPVRSGARTSSLAFFEAMAQLHDDAALAHELAAYCHERAGQLDRANRARRYAELEVRTAAELRERALPEAP